MNNKLADLLKPFKSVEITYSRKNQTEPAETQNGKAEPGKDHTQIKSLEDQNGRLKKEIKHLQKKLFETETKHIKFLSIIAHDLRSPFHSILGALELLHMKLEEYQVKDLGNYINMASDSANRTLKLLDNLLAWTMSQNEENSFNPVRVSLFELLETEIDNFSFTAQQKQILLHHSIVSQLNVTADLEMLKTVLRNILDNAVKFTNKGGEIAVSATERGQFVEIVVADNGIGMSQDIQKKLFKTDAFHSSAGTNNERGSGFGLLVCKDFVKLHGGTICVESEPGKGSRFKFTMPHYL